MTDVVAGHGDRTTASVYTAPLAALFARRGRWLALVAGALLPLAYAPFGAFPLAPLLLTVLFLILDDVGPGEAARRGFLFGFGAFLAGIHWIYISLHVFGKLPLYLSVPLMLALILFMALYVALVAWAAARLAPQPGLARWLVVLPALWTLAEWLRGWVLSGFPWLALGYSQTDSPLAGYAPVAGVFAVSLVVAMSAGALRLLLAAPARQRGSGLAALVVLWGAGAALDRAHWSEPTGEALDVRIVQGAVPQERKWLPEELQPTMALYANLTLEHLGADLIVWPEAAIPALRGQLEDYFAAVGDRVTAAGGALLVGAIEYREDTGQFFNGVIAPGSDSPPYHKRHLVPFGEYLPVPGFVREWVRLRNLPYPNYHSGPSDQPPMTVAGQRVAVSICYEDVFGEELIYAYPEATLLVNVSNDAWFGDSVAPHQHLQIARMRTIEAARPMIRATNTGISALIDAKGSVTGLSPQFETDVLAGPVQPATGLTPYARAGNALVVIAALLLLGIGALAGRRR